jgi:hypothetical protein
VAASAISCAHGVAGDHLALAGYGDVTTRDGYGDYNIVTDMLVNASTLVTPA